MVSALPSNHGTYWDLSLLSLRIRLTRLRSVALFTNCHARLAPLPMLVKVLAPWNHGSWNMSDIPPLSVNTRPIWIKTWTGKELKFSTKNPIGFAEGVKESINIKRTNSDLNRDGAPPPTQVLQQDHLVTVMWCRPYPARSHDLSSITITSVGIEDYWMSVAGHHTTKLSRENIVKLCSLSWVEIWRHYTIILVHTPVIQESLQHC